MPTEQLVEVILALHNLYQRPKAHYMEVNPDVLKQQQPLSGLGIVKQLTPGPEGNDSPAAHDSSVLRGGTDLVSQQYGPQVATAPVATCTTGPPVATVAADMLAAAVAAAQQRLQGTTLTAGGASTASGAALAGPTAVSVQQTRQDPDVVLIVQPVRGLGLLTVHITAFFEL